MDNLEQILAANSIGTLATINNDGSPWATPVHIFADNDSLYWFSQATHQHSLNIAHDPRVSVALWSRTDRTAGGYVSGSAIKLSAEETAAALALVTAILGHIPPYFQGTFGYKVALGTPDLSKSSPNRWYFYS